MGGLGEACNETDYSESCSGQPCDRNCAIEWTEWTQCEYCTQSRHATVVEQPRGGGAACPTRLFEEQMCQPCDGDKGPGPFPATVPAIAYRIMRSEKRYRYFSQFFNTYN